MHLSIHIRVRLGMCPEKFISKISYKYGLNYRYNKLDDDVVPLKLTIIDIFTFI